jgi:C-terminal processing protease CtpA/Prc
MKAQVLLFWMAACGVTFAQAHEGTEPTQNVFTPAERTQIANALADRLKDRYILPETGLQMSSYLKDRIADGTYLAGLSPFEFARVLTTDLQAQSHDKHLRVAYSRDVLPPEGEPDEEHAAKNRTAVEKTNCGFERLEVLPGNFGYIQMTYFGDVENCRATAAAAMDFLSHASALIFDLRQNRGGDPRMVTLMLSYLFGQKTHMEDIYQRSRNKKTEYWTTPKKIKVHLGKTPVFVLMSRSTVSGAEQFCYDLKNLNRATLIGERTAGASHPVRYHRLNDNFYVALPEYRYISPLTKGDWEGTGVSPEVRASYFGSPQVAMRLARIRLEHEADATATPATVRTTAQ